jgi:hypothetical protein
MNMMNSTIDSFATSKFQPNDIIFHKVIDTKSNNVLDYKNTEFLLTKLVEYVKDIFLMIRNYLYPSKINSFMEQQIYLYPDRMFRKYKNPN